MKILMLVNWKVKYGNEKPDNLQPPDYYVEGEDYWFFRYFKNKPEVDVLDISSFDWLEKFEKNTLRFYIWQALRAIPKLNQYDLVISHGMQSGVVICLWRRFFRTRAKHVVFDIGSFNSARENGVALKLMQYASKSIDLLLYHTSSQKKYYEKCFSWLLDKSKFLRFGTDLDFFSPEQLEESQDKDKYIICVGYAKRDWDTLVEAYEKLDTDITLRLIGRVEEKYKGKKGIEQIPFIPIKDLINQIRNSLFGVLPLESFNYSYGQMTLMQQMALGKCVIAAGVPSLVDYAQNGSSAIFYEPKNSQDLAKKMAELIKESVIRERVARQARKFLLEECNEKIMAAKIENALERIQKKQVLYLTNIEVPYRTKFFNELSKECDLTVLFEREKSRNRDDKWTRSENARYRKKCYNGIKIGDENALSLKFLLEIFKNYDVVIVGCYNSIIQVCAIFLMRLFNVKYFVNVDGEQFLYEKGLKSAIKKQLLSKTTVLAAGLKTAENIKEDVSEVRVIPYAFSSLSDKEIENNAKLSNEAQRKETILVIGQYYDYKGLDVAIEVARRDRLMNYKFVGMGKRTELFVKEQNVRKLDNVEVIPFLAKEDLTKEYLNCAMLVLPSRQECWGLVVNEAASLGIPIVSTWGSGAAIDFLADSEFECFLAEPGDADSLLEKINLLKNYDNKDEYKKHLLEKSKNYSIQENVQAHVRAIES